MKAGKDRPEPGTYRKFYQRLLVHPFFAKKLTYKQQRLVWDILGGPQTNRVGLFRYSPGHAAVDVTTPAEDPYTPLEILADIPYICEGFGWQYDTGAEVLLIPTWWKYNYPASPLNMMGAMRDAMNVPKSPLWPEFVRASEKYLRGLFLRAFRDSLVDPSVLDVEGEGEEEEDDESPVEDVEDATV